MTDGALTVPVAEIVWACDVLAAPVMDGAEAVPVALVVWAWDVAAVPVIAPPTPPPPLNNSSTIDIVYAAVYSVHLQLTTYMSVVALCVASV